MTIFRYDTVNFKLHLRSLELLFRKERHDVYVS